MATDWDVIVVGAGIEGSATAYELAKAGQRTLLLEQFPLPHSRGSSHGHSRIIRKAYSEDYYARMMVDAYCMWHDLEQQSSTSLIRPTGLLTVCKGRNPIVNSLKNIGSKYRELTAEQMASEYPMLNFPAEYSGVYDYDGGVINADKALAAYQREFVKLGGVIRDEEGVNRIEPGSLVAVHTNKDRYSSKKIVIAAGPWTNKLTEPLGLKLPLKMKCIGVYYWRDDTARGDFSAARGFPAYSEFPPGSPSSAGIYAVPSSEYPRFCKVCLHNGVEIDPDDRDKISDGMKQKYLESISDYVKQHMPGLNPKPSISETCIYTLTPDENFILDAHPDHPNVIIAAGFSGHGFKLAPVVGRILTELAVKPQSLTYDLTPFKISRFAGKIKSNL
ncbi:hypothetical protein CAPTEDRAFT_226581 [Capitella teleta]|uniref:sarcosine oxidasee (formaldehyde-forming) n=1 Tax=Capitella teleta TaxID=283909 RepID=R7T9D0_CAPTE|nr:hypothetical protein CAPTEDRAFT_226581 [Capitella teleta]|eukprot:ELT87604.1 hypothetical protein CAPTEDRAFT_226581 [Capitella teleta]